VKGLTAETLAFLLFIGLYAYGSETGQGGYMVFWRIRVWIYLAAAMAGFAGRNGYPAPVAILIDAMALAVMVAANDTFTAAAFAVSMIWAYGGR